MPNPPDSAATVPVTPRRGIQTEDLYDENEGYQVAINVKLRSKV